MTPKHIGLASSLHQATRSKGLVHMFYRAGHIMSYHDILKLDTALAENTLQTMSTDGSVLSPNLVKDRFVHFSADNIDTNDRTLDRKNTFHATQVAAWQRGPPSKDILNCIKLSTRETLNVPDVMNNIFHANIPPSKPSFTDDLQADWFSGSSDICNTAKKAKAKDLAFVMTRENEITKCTWTSFNKKHSTIHTEKTTTGYLPIIQAPANDLDTLNTIVRRILHIAQSLGQKRLVLTVDEGLFPKLMELKWSVPEYKDILIPRLGGLHTAMNFQGCLGQHMQDSGLGKIWTESGLLGDNSVQQIMAGKSYARSVRAHKLTFQPLWQFFAPKVV